MFSNPIALAVFAVVLAIVFFTSPVFILACVACYAAGAATGTKALTAAKSKFKS